MTRLAGVQIVHAMRLAPILAMRYLPGAQNARRRVALGIIDMARSAFARSGGIVMAGKALADLGEILSRGVLAVSYRAVAIAARISRRYDLFMAYAQPLAFDDL
jgi:hypothetical protein